MIHSMTGYGVLSRTIQGREVTLQIKSVNGRYLDIYMKGPSLPVDLDQAMKERLKARLSRGRVDLFVDVTSSQGDVRTLNPDAARAYYSQLETLRVSLGLSEPVTLKDVLGLPGVLEGASGDYMSDAEFQSGVLALLEDVLDQFLRMRATEGETLGKIIQERLDVIEADVDAIAVLQKDVAQGYRDKLRKRISELLEGTAALDEGRLAQEVAYLADRSEIAEELDRFRSHIRQFRKALSQGGPLGKKLDFLVQEMNRETNTIQSKSDLLEVNHRGINIKAELEKIREQIQNLE